MPSAIVICNYMVCLFLLGSPDIMEVVGTFKVLDVDKYDRYQLLHTES